MGFIFDIISFTSHENIFSETRIFLSVLDWVGLHGSEFLSHIEFQTGDEDYNTSDGIIRALLDRYIVDPKVIIKK
jgi:hypothetical protein